MTSPHHSMRSNLDGASESLSRSRGRDTARHTRETLQKRRAERRILKSTEMEETPPVPPPPAKVLYGTSVGPVVRLKDLQTSASTVTVSHVEMALRACWEDARLLSRSVSEMGQLERALQQIAEAFLARKHDLELHVPEAQWPAAVPTSVPGDVYSSAYPSPVTHPLVALCRALVALHEKMVRYKTHILPLAHVKRRKLGRLFEYVVEGWRDLLIYLTLTMATASSAAAASATGNIQKLAVATGAPDWEDLSIDDAQKLFIQGDKFFLGFGTARSYDVAFRRYMAAARKGLPDAMFMLGAMFENGLGRPKDMAAAVKWYEEAARQDHVEAMFSLGRIHELGDGMATDPGVAITIYREAAERSHHPSMVALGSLLERGYGCEQNIPEAVRWYRLAADAEYAPAQAAIGRMYYLGLGVERNFTDAVIWFRKAAENGSAIALNDLGICYEEGRGVGKDWAMAKTLYKRATEKNHAGGANNYGYLCMKEKNFTEAIRLFHLAMSLGSVDAVYNLATLYEEGCRDGDGAVLTQDVSMAMRYYKEAAEKVCV
ncbi:hypothetical protein BC832DRAFT_202273 [Gaertneriomyces semiglobifer]|nr:hypothetical protein BC832DRAFT_202273 [Gaertneriomyces semiglobifer]